MSFIAKVFSGKKEEKAPTASDAIQKLRDTEEMLTKKQDFLERKIESELGIVKKNGTTNKRVAIQALKRKKRYEKQLQQIDGVLSTIEMQRETLEGANTNTAVLQTMKFAADALKSAHQHMDVDQVHDMMDDIAEQQDLAKEISDAISNPVTFVSDIDEEELERELEDLKQMDLDNELIKTGPTPSTLPSVPNTPLPAKTKNQDEDELNQLMQWAT